MTEAQPAALLRYGHGAVGGIRYGVQLTGFPALPGLQRLTVFAAHVFRTAPSARQCLARETRR
ncbi:MULTISPECIES: hypothetical protein [Streptomyces]|uniref:hypothetical protein n=1 Tax=Streptomyces TaxID=1883 RepID=UPI0013E050AD|nr:MULTISPECIES: hypothetical protein [unclassified Streptomyces]